MTAYSDNKTELVDFFQKLTEMILLLIIIIINLISYKLSQLLSTIENLYLMQFESKIVA